MAIVPDSFSYIDSEFQTNNILPSHDYYLDRNTHEITGFVDGADQYEQSIYLTLLTERYSCDIFPDDDYGVEINHLIGKSLDFIKPNIEYEIKQALSIDTRYRGAKNFNFEVVEQGLIVYFTVESIFGDIEINFSVPLR